MAAQHARKHSGGERMRASKSKSSNSRSRFFAYAVLEIFAIDKVTNDCRGYSDIHHRVPGLDLGGVESVERIYTALQAGSVID